MALSEVPVNHIRRNRRALETPPDSSPDESRYRHIPTNGAGASFMPTPSSIQSMLKNTTETGDVSQLAFQARGPGKPRMNDMPSRPMQQTPPPRRSGSIGSVPRRQHHGYGKPPDRGTPHTAMRSQAGTTSGASSIYSMYRNRSETSFRSQSRAPSRGPSRGPSLGPEEVEESYFTLQHSSSDRSFAGYPTHPAFQLRSPAQIHNARTKSPFAYPTRLKRPGYRPSSPALSEAYKAAARAPYGIQSSAISGAASFRTVSPLSVYSVKIPVSGWQQNPNPSDPILSRQRFSPKEERGDGSHTQNPYDRRIDPSRAFTHTPTPVIPAMYPSIDSVSTAEASTPPLFYDYSEDFQQEYLPSTSQPAPIINALPIKTDKRRSYFELDADAGNVTDREPYIAELPAEGPPSKRNSVRASQYNASRMSIHGQPDPVYKRISDAYSVRDAAIRSDTPAFERAENSSKRVSKTQRAEEPTMPGSFSAVDADQVEICEANHESKAQESEDHLREDFENTNGSASNAAQDPPLVLETTGYRILSSYKRGQEFFAKTSNRTLGTTNVSLYSGRSQSSSSTDSMYSTRSVSQPGQDRQPKVGLGLGQSSSPLQAENLLPLDKTRKASSEADDAARPQTAQTEIHSPIPKRSMSSPSHRERFSNILSIDEGLLELDELAQGSKRLGKASIAGIFAKNRSSISRSEPIHRVSTTHYVSPTLQDISEAQALASIGERTGVIPHHVLNDPVNEQIHREDAAPTDAKETFEHSSKVERVSSTTCRQKALKMSRSTINLLNGPGASSFSSRLDQEPVSYSQNSSSIEKHEKPHTMKELPLRPRSSVISIAPPQQKDSAALPFSFTPLRPEERDHDAESVAELGRLAASYLHQAEASDREPTKTLQKRTPKACADQVSLVSSLPSRQVHTEYGKAEESRGYEIGKPASTRDSIHPNLSPSKQPRFKLKVHRASSSTARMTKITKPPPSADPVIQTNKERYPQRKASISIKSKPFSKRSRHKPILPTQDNSSRPGPVRTRFIESFNLPPQTFPAITLVPPSPGLNLEAQSFFSDDSSQLPPKGSLRKRISQIRAIASRASTSDDMRGPDRRLLNSAMGKSKTSGRTSRQSSHSQRSDRSTQALHRSRYARWRVVQKLKAWLYRIKLKFTEQERPITTELYPGV